MLTTYQIIYAGSALEVLFAEELGLVLEVAPTKAQHVIKAYESRGVTCQNIGISSQSEVLEGSFVFIGSVRWCS